MKNLMFAFTLLLFNECVAQNNVGIGTVAPNSKAILDIKSTEKGVLFPRMSSDQRNAISNPPNGLHVFNTDERCLNFYDSVYRVWNCYCYGDTCRKATIRIMPGCNIDFKNTYYIKYPGYTRLFLIVESGDTLYGCGAAALNFATMTNSVTITLINRGVIIGNGGIGGNGATGNAGSCIRVAGAGGQGGHAIQNVSGVFLEIENYGLIAAGGGGGGGGGSTGANIYGGGGGGGAGFSFPSGGNGGGETFAGPFGICGTINKIAIDGQPGAIDMGGTGGAGANGGGTGGTGGLQGQVGQPGTGNNPGAGGLAGKAISGGTGNIIRIMGSGQIIGQVD